RGHVPQLVVSIRQLMVSRTRAPARRALPLTYRASHLIVTQHRDGCSSGDRALPPVSVGQSGRWRCGADGGFVIIEGRSRRSVGVILLRGAVEFVILHAAADAAGIDPLYQLPDEGIWCWTDRIRIVGIRCRPGFRIVCADQERKAVIDERTVHAALV